MAKKTSTDLTKAAAAHRELAQFTEEPIAAQAAFESATAFAEVAATLRKTGD